MINGETKVSQQAATCWGLGKYIDPYPRAPSIQILPTLGSKVRK